jgi:hypothetical protein
MYTNTAKRVQGYLRQLYPENTCLYEEMNNLALAIVRGIVEESLSGSALAGTYINSATGELCWYATFTAGENISKGSAVCFLQNGIKNTVNLCPITGDSIDMPIGIALDTVTAGQAIRVVKKGLVLALPDSGITAIKGYVVTTGTTTAGRLAQAINAGTAQHWREVGHWSENGSGNGALALITVHFN